MSVFIDCLVDGNFLGLVREGCPAETVQEIWTGHYSEWLTLMSDNEITSGLRQMKEIARLQLKLSRIQRLVDVLRECGYHEELAAELELPEPASAEAWQLALNRVIANLMPENIRLKQLQQASQGRSDKVTIKREDFEAAVIEFEEMQGGAQMDINSLTVRKYCMYSKKLKRQVEAAVKATKKARNGR